MSRELAERRRRSEEARRALHLVPDEHEDSPHDRALTLGMKPDTANAYLGCSWCADLPHRRRQPQRPGCAKEYRAEVVTLEIPSVQSTLFRAEDFS